jgi:hypothetical protein
MSTKEIASTGLGLAADVGGLFGFKNGGLLD